MLDILKKINGNMEKIEVRFDNLENKVDKLEEGQEKIVLRLDNLEKGQEELKDRLDNMSKDMTREFSNIAGKISGIDAITVKNVSRIADLDTEVTKLKAIH